MGYAGENIADLIEGLRKATTRAGERLCDAMVDRGMTNIEKNTPVETYHLRRSYKRTPVHYGQSVGATSLQWAAYAWEGRVFTEVEYAPYVELGTGLWGPQRKKYIIKPKKPGGILAFTPYQRMPNGGVVLDVGHNIKKGGKVFVRFVMHPGSPGAHMFTIGCTLTEHEMQDWSREPLRLWQREVESGGLAKVV